MKRLIVSALGIAILAVGISTALPAQTRTQPANASPAAEFDHSTCQYPDRTTNPVDGCDNSDPCDPENTKGGSGECLKPEINENPAPNPVIEPKTAPINQCGGK